MIRLKFQPRWLDSHRTLSGESGVVQYGSNVVQWTESIGLRLDEERTMGDKGKKDKAKGQKQKGDKKEKASKEKRDKASKRKE